MPVIFAGIVPGSPLLLPGLVKSVSDQVIKTTTALAKIRNLVETAKGEILVIIGRDDANATSSPLLLQSPFFAVNFAEQGDLITKLNLTGAVGFVHSLKESLQAKFEIPMRTPKKLPLCIALAFLNLPNIPVAPIILPANLSPQLLLDFGTIIGDFFKTQSKRIVVLVSGLLAAATHLSQEKKVLSSTLLSLITHSDSEALLQLSPSLKISLKDTLVDALIMLYHSLPTTTPKTTVLSYEEASGVTHLVAKINW